ncbi:MAG: transporter, partial [Leeuwenhoekiella sp.]
MKKLTILLSVSLCSFWGYSQTISDAVRYTNQNITGTARYQGVSGAFGALGGDLSALNNNPASSAIFLNSYASVTAAVDFYDNNTNYFNGLSSSNESDLNFNQAGGVFILNNNQESSGFKKLAFSFNYDRTANFDNSFLARGTTSTSIDSYFLNSAQGVPLDLLQTQDNESISDLYQYLGENESYSSQQAFLGYQGFIIDPVEDTSNNTDYTSNLSSGNFDQDYSSVSTGYSGKASFNVATQYGKKLYLGLNLNSHFIDYRQTTVLFEDNSNAGSDVNSIRFENYLSTLGNGFSFQLGGILAATPSLRLGLTYDSPTWYNIKEETTQSLRTEGTNGSTNVSPIVVNI